MREEMQLPIWIEGRQDWLNYLDEIVVIASLLDYELKYEVWGYGFYTMIEHDEEKEGIAWGMTMSRSDKQGMIVFNFSGDEFKRIYMHFNGKIIKGNKEKRIRKLKELFRKWL